MNLKQRFFKLIGQDEAVPIKLKNRHAKIEEASSISPGLKISKLLKNARIQSGQELKDVSNILKIRYDYLKSIEAGLYGSLPGRAYTMGFIKSYANYLKLDAQQLINSFKADSHILEPTNLAVFPSSAPEGKIPTMIVMLGAVLMAGTVFFIWTNLQKPKAIAPNHSNLISKTILETTTQPSSPLLESKPQELVFKSKKNNSVTDTVIGTNKTPRELKKNKEQYSEDLVRKNTPLNKAVAPPSGLTKVTFPKEQKTIDKLKYIAPSSPKELLTRAKNATTKPTTSIKKISKNSPSSDTSNLSIEAKADSWVQVQASESDIIFSRILKTGERYDVPNRNDLYLTTGNIGALIIKLDGKIVPKPIGLSRVAKNIALNRKSFTEDQPRN